MIQKITDLREVYGTSYFGETVNCSKSDLFEIFGEPSYTIGFEEHKKTHNEWDLKSDEGFVFTIYDYKEPEYSYYQNIDWHIGAKNRYYAEKAKALIYELLNEMYEPFNKK